jgi:pilus assembly protein CpaF
MEGVNGMALSSIQRIGLANEAVATGGDVATTGGNGTFPGNGAEPEALEGRPDLSGLQRIGLADEENNPNGNAKKVSTDGAVERGFSALSPDLAKRAVWVAEQLRPSLEANVVLERSQEVLNLIYARYKLLCRHLKLLIPPEVEQDFLKVVVDELVGFGPLEAPLSDDEVTEIMVNGPDLVYVEKGGKTFECDVRFVDDDHVLRVINHIIEPLGRRIDHAWPMVDARLPDGSRVNAVIPPCAIDGPNITIRKFSKVPFQVEDLIRFGTLTQEMADFLKACVVSKLNVLVSGGTGSGKTTLLNVLSGFIPEGERIVTIEDAAELQLNQRHVVRLETKHAIVDGARSVTIRDLVVNSLRMRPERIIVGECRSGEALDMLQAMNTGHDGSLTTVHANTPRDTISRLETLVLMAGMDLPLQVVRKQISSAIDVIVQQARLRDGSRKIVSVTEVQGTDGNAVTLQDIFTFVEEGEEDGKVIGRFEPTGIRPKFDTRLKVHGFNLPATVFTKRS